MRCVVRIKSAGCLLELLEIAPREPAELASAIAANFTSGFVNYPYWTVDLFNLIHQCPESFAEPTVEIFFLADKLISDPTISADALKLLLRTQTLCYKLFPRLGFCNNLPEGLGSRELEFVEKSLSYLAKKWPSSLTKEAHEFCFVMMEYLIFAIEEGCPALEPYATNMTLKVLEFLEEASASPFSTTHDRLIVAVVDFFIQLLYVGWLPWGKYSDKQIHERIIFNVVIPNVQLRNDDEELFEAYPIEYIKMEEVQFSDSSMWKENEEINDVLARRRNWGLKDSYFKTCCTRRGAAFRLLKRLILDKNYYDIIDIFALISDKIQGMLSCSALEKWKREACALRLLAFLGGAAFPHVEVDLPDVLFKHIDAEAIINGDVNEFPILKADVLKFHIFCWNRVPESFRTTMKANLMKFFGSQSIVVRAYASALSDKLFSSKSDVVPWNHEYISSPDSL